MIVKLIIQTSYKLMALAEIIISGLTDTGIAVIDAVWLSIAFFTMDSIGG